MGKLEKQDRIPKQLQDKDFRFVPMIEGTKRPKGECWQTTNNFHFYNPEIKNSSAYGVVCGFGNLFVIDFDSKEMQEELLKLLPKTFAVKSGGRGLLHLYYRSNTSPEGFKVNDSEGKRLIDIQGIGGCVVGAGSKHCDTGKIYEVVQDLPIETFNIQQLRDLIPKKHNIKGYAGGKGTQASSLDKCIFHDEKNPSMAVYNDTGTFYCFGCQAYGFLEVLNRKKPKKKETKNGTFYYLEREDEARYKELIKEVTEKVEKKERPSEKAIEILKSPDLLNKFMDEFSKKVVGEEETLRSLFISCCSIYVKGINLLPHCFVTGESSGGKSWVAKKVFDIFPEKQTIHRTKLTPEVFTYWHNSNWDKKWTWDGKILYIEDPKNSFLNSDTFKVFMTEGASSTIVVNQKAIDIKINGKPLCLLTTAETQPKKETINRFNVVPIDESPEQTHKVLIFEAEGESKGDYDSEIKNALKYLERVRVKIPYAEKVVSCFPIANIRVRRDFKRFLALIKSSCALHQHQRKKEGEFFLAEATDYEIARKILSHMQSNEMMIALTHKDKKAYDTCIKLTEKKKEEVERLKESLDDCMRLNDEDKKERVLNDIELNWGFKVPEVFAYNPTLASEKTWYDLIQSLGEMGLLEAKECKAKVKHRLPILYRAKKMKALELPSFDKL